MDCYLHEVKRDVTTKENGTIWIEENTGELQRAHQWEPGSPQSRRFTGLKLTAQTLKLTAPNYKTERERDLSAKVKMNRDERRSFGRTSLKDQWEQKAQSIADHNKQEKEWQKKSSMSVVGSKWSYHHSLINKNGPSDSRKPQVTRMKTKKAKNQSFAQSSGPLPSQTQNPASCHPPVPRRRDSPKLKRVKRKVEVDVFKICWKDSWMSLKPPKYLFLRMMELRERLGFTPIQLCPLTLTKYRAQDHSSSRRPEPATCGAVAGER
ncbi:hypothetical protein WMY93_014209 [Mugilogobius chulae]|uniref:Uncharacterized protein n=1 Tax=Mugilogobius chulae TaxID=88201 RepID=A0AAW0NY42_9GOBI